MIIKTLLGVKAAMFAAWFIIGGGIAVLFHTAFKKGLIMKDAIIWACVMGAAVGVLITGPSAAVEFFNLSITLPTIP